MQFRGIGMARAVAVAAALELGRRRREEEIDRKPRSTPAVMPFHNASMVLGDLLHEEFWILLLNRSNRVLEAIRTSQGGISGTVTDIRMILKNAILRSASSIILCHNHPSGNLKPSKADMDITKEMNEAGKANGYQGA
jgi:DNA repair protein RadC